MTTYEVLSIVIAILALLVSLIGIIVKLIHRDHKHKEVTALSLRN